MLFQALQGNSLRYPRQKRSTLAGALSQRGTSAATPAWEHLPPVPALPRAAFAHSCSSATAVGARQVTGLIQIANHLFYLQDVLNPDCFCYQSDTRNCSAGATEEVGPWDAVGRKAVRIAGTTKEACLGSDGLFP